VVTNTNVPQQPITTGSEIPGSAAPSLPGPSFPQTTKPRQIPGGGEMPGAAPGFDPASNGAANLPAPATLGAEPVTDDTMANPTITNDSGFGNPRVSAIAFDIIRDNPGLSHQEAHRLATLAFQRYLMREPGWQHNPLAVVAAKDVLDPEAPEGRGEPLPPGGPERPQERHQDVPGGQHWYQQQGETPRDLANGVVPAENTLWERMTGGHENPHPGGHR
jgi:hypothetical protein